MASVCEEMGVQVTEFTVSPQIQPQDNGAPYHEWLVEFNVKPVNPEAFATKLNDAMVDQNIYYKDLIAGNVLRSAVVSEIAAGGFHTYLQSKGKLGGQNKIPRLMNNRTVADELSVYKVSPG